MKQKRHSWTVPPLHRLAGTTLFRPVGSARKGVLGGFMQRRFLKAIVLLLVCFSIVGQVGASQSIAGNPAKRQLKARQKTARKLLRAQERNTNKALKSASTSSAQRAQVKHQMKRGRRELRRRQKDELQDLKDRQKIATERSRHT